MTASRTAPGTRILDRRDGPPALVAPRARLVVSAGPDQGKELLLAGTGATVGSGPENDLVLHDEAVSTRHFEVARTEIGALLRDLGSTNGTFVDGVRSLSVYLAQRAEIACGGTTLLFESLRDEVEIPLTRRTNFGALLGHGSAMRAAIAVLERAAKSQVTVLITGESGTGKELAARALHEESPRKDGPYVVFDCGAATPTLLESQLFGHVKGAFTGAHADREGVFEAADGGTLVLDEIGELPLDLQPKLLRALETRTVQRVGETKSRTVDVRFVASTNRNLEEEVACSRFRQDLFFRLSVVAVRLPPLRDRKEEIPRLVRHFLAQVAGESAKEAPREVLAMFTGHDWPGNVRELRNAVERFVALPDLPMSSLLGRRAGAGESGESAESLSELPYHAAKELWADRFERAYLEKLLEKHGENLSEAARVAGLSRQSCYRLMKKHGLRA